MMELGQQVWVLHARGLEKPYLERATVVELNNRDGAILKGLTGEFSAVMGYVFDTEDYAARKLSQAIERWRDEVMLDLRTTIYEFRRKLDVTHELVAAIHAMAELESAE